MGGDKKDKQFRAVRLRLRPNKAAKQHIDAIRYIWNHFLATYKLSWRAKKLLWFTAAVKDPGKVSYKKILPKVQKAM